MSNLNINWVTWSSISEIIKKKNLSLIAWGKSEDWLPKVLRKHKLSKIIDSSKSLDGESYEGIPIVNPKRIKKNDWQKFYIIICSSAFDDIKTELESYGLVENQNFSVLPDLKDIQLVEDVATFSCEFLLTSSDYDNAHSQRGSSLGGGIYHCRLNSSGLFIEKKINGQYREIKLYKNKFYAINSFLNKITVFDKNFNIFNEIDTEFSNSCGIELINDYIYISNSSRDSIITFDNNHNKVSEQFISSLAGKKGNSRHHINDLSSINNQLIVTMFSRSGFWRNGVFDGHLVSLNSDLKIDQTLYQGLSQPHTPRVFDGEVAFADSFAGGLSHGTNGTIFKVDGFLRGIEKVGPFWLIGQSQTLYLERRVGKSGKVFLNSGIYVFNEQTKVYAFHSIKGIKNIHSLVII